jgi:radical SAM protein with 4Fe4S-binding SPASM domain
MPTVIVKVTEACNSNCAYCDVIRKGSKVKTISEDLLAQFFKRVNEFLLEHPDEDFEVIWHGGEPMMLGPEYYYRVLEIQNKYCKETAPRIDHAMQSNLTLFSSKFTEIFNLLGIDSIGTSYDPTPCVRGPGKEVDSITYNRKFLEGVEKLEAEGFSWGIIHVVTKHSLKDPLGIFHFLANMTRDGSMMLNPVLFYKDEPRSRELGITPKQYADFLGEIFPAWWQNRKRHPSTDPFRTMVDNLVNSNPSLLCNASGVCSESHFGMTPDGMISQCGCASDWGEMNYGSIYDRSFTKILKDPIKKMLRERTKLLEHGECKDCRFWTICHGGCSLDAWAISRNYMDKTPWCVYTKRFIQKYFEPITGIEYIPGSMTTNEIDAFQKKPKELPQQIQGKWHPPVNLDKIAEPVWINLLGNMGDALMVSGILKQVVERDPTKKFNLVARASYEYIFKGHPAIEQIGHPPADAVIFNTAYWEHRDFGKPNKKAYHILAKMFKLISTVKATVEAPVEERLFIPNVPKEDSPLTKKIPFKERNILISPSVISPRMELEPERWEELVERLKGDGIFVAQSGPQDSKYIRGTFSLLGLTTPMEELALLKHFDLVITTDNPMIYLAHLAGVPAVVLWGPTNHLLFGFEGQGHIQANPSCDYPNGCINSKDFQLIETECPMGTDHCINQLDVETIYKSVIDMLNGETSKGLESTTHPVP